MMDWVKAAIIGLWHVTVAASACSLAALRLAERTNSQVQTALLAAVVLLSVATAIIWVAFIKAAKQEAEVGSV